MCYLCLWNFMVNLMLRLFFTWGNYVINLMLLKINVRIMWVLSMLAELVLVRNSTSLLLVRIMWVILRWNFCLCVFKLVTERDVQWANYKQKHKKLIIVWSVGTSAFRFPERKLGMLHVAFYGCKPDVSLTCLGRHSTLTWSACAFFSVQSSINQ
jgi:hypothetical protein